MKISTRGRYGLRILLDIAAQQPGGRPRMIREIATSQEISEKYISRLVIALRRAGFVKSVRGAGGGYGLALPPEKIRLLDVLEVMEGRIELVECREGGERICSRRAFCPAHRLWQEMSRKVRDVLADYTLKDLLTQEYPDASGRAPSL